MPSPELQTIISLMRSLALVSGTSFAEMRANMESATSMAPLPEGVALEAVDAGGVPAEWVSVPGVRGDRVVLYLHGGGYCIGSTRTHRALVSAISRAAGARVLSVDYRLGPENPHPAALEDAQRAYGFLLRHADPRKVAVAGDSAGGGLTVATLMALRDAKMPLPAAGVCISPWLDLTQSGESISTRATLDPLLDRARLDFFASGYLATKDPRIPSASPLFGSAEGLPPMLIQVGTAEILLDDSTRFAKKARAAGVDVTLEVWDDMIHVWHAFAAMLPEGQEAIERIGAYLRGRWGE